PENNQGVTESVSISTKDLEAGTIGNPTTAQPIETEEVSPPPDTMFVNRNGTGETDVPKSKQTGTPQEKEMTREAEKEEITDKEYNIEDLKNTPGEMTAFLLDLKPQEQRKQQQHQKKAKRSRRKKDQRPRRGTPEQLAQSITYIVQILGGNPKWQQS